MSTNKELVRIFDEIGDLLEITGGDRFRVNSYRRVARALKDVRGDVAELAAEGELKSIEGVGESSIKKIKEYLESGRIGLHQELLDKVPEALPSLLGIPGLGPKKIKQLHEELKIENLDDLKKALDEGKVAALSGFGKKTAENIQSGIAFLESSSGRTPLGLARPVALMLQEEVAKIDGVKRVEIAGSLRRGCETIGDVDLLCDAEHGPAVVESFTSLPQVKRVLAAGDTKGSILIEHPQGGDLQVDLRVVPTESFGAALQYFTGSKEHNVRLREIAIRKKWRLNEYGLFDDKEKSIAGKDEAGIYKKLGVTMVSPELREDRGEFDLAAESIPEWITLDDIRGDLHMHTTASDGKAEIAEMAEAAKARGYKMIAITDHSRSSVIANGLDTDRLLSHVEAIRKANDEIKGITILAGTECDILPDGSLDYPDDVLAELDWVVASIHSAQGRDIKSQTQRCLSAIENPHVCVLGHPSGRLLGQRDAMEIDWQQVVAAAAETGTALEINASWKRLDLKDVHARMAMDAGCWISINTDSHHPDQLEQMELGVITARRGWVTKERVLNTFTPTQLRKWIDKKRKS